MTVFLAITQKPLKVSKDTIKSEYIVKYYFGHVPFK